MGLGVPKEGSACSLWWKLLKKRLEAFLMGKSQAGEISKLLNTYLGASLPHACGLCKSHSLHLLFRRVNGNQGVHSSLAVTIPEAQPGSV